MTETLATAGLGLFALAIITNELSETLRHVVATLGGL